ncbi:MAG: hypothetical protein ACYTEP_06930 [Planctomycetota bacterium]|jgi:hypothetical protein
MSRILLILLGLFGLFLASCSSSPTMMGGQHKQIDSSINTDPINPHPRGISNAGAGFDKYWLGNNSDSPYAHEDRGFFSILFGGGESFGDVTHNTWRPKTDIYASSDSYASLHKWVMNRDSSDPYVR